MSTTEPTTIPIAGTDAATTAPEPGVGEMPTPREIVAIITAIIWTGITWIFGESEAYILWGIFFGLGMFLDLLDTAWRFHYRKEWAGNQILWWTQPHYVVAAILGVVIDWVYPINLTLSFIVTIVVGVLISIPIERYYVSLKDSE